MLLCFINEWSISQLIFLTQLLPESSIGILSLGNLIISLVLAYLLSSLLGIVYKKYARTLSNHEGLANVFPLLSIVTTLVIAVVKSSLALSLGLVGALSIVRFRTPVKEPEELTYLFFCIAIGLSLGADQYLAAIIGSSLGFISIIISDKLKSRRKLKSNNNLRLLIDGINAKDIDEFISILKEHVQAIDFTNLIMNNFEENNNLSMVLTVKSNKINSISTLTKNVQERFNNCKLTIIDSEKL